MFRLARRHDDSPFLYRTVLGRCAVGVLSLTAWVALMPLSRAQTNKFDYLWAGLTTDSFTLDGNEVWTVGDGGRIRHRSTSTGAWTSQSVPDAVKDTLRHITFVPDGIPADGMTGWAVGDKGWVIKTTNGGTNWTTLGSQMPAVLDAAHLPPLAPPFEQLYDVQFLDTNTGWLCGLHGIWKTTDGGANWNPCELRMQDNARIDGDQDFLQGVELYTLDIVDRGGGSLLGFAGAEPGLVFRTTNGTVWKVVLDVRCMCTQSLPSCPPYVPTDPCTQCYDCTSLPPIDGCLGAPAVPPDALACEWNICYEGSGTAFEMWDVEISRHPTDKLVLAVGGQYHVCGMIFSSSDDGDHWRKESHECHSTGLPGGIDCSSAADTTYLYHDLPAAIPPPAGWYTHTYRRSNFGTLYGAALFDADNSAIAGAYGGQIVVRDPVNGVWKDRSEFNARVQEVENAVTVPYYGAAGDDGSSTTGRGVATGAGGLLRQTTDGGQHWNDVATLEHCTPWRIADVAFPSDLTGFQAGQFTRIGKSTNAGVKWDHFAAPPNLNAPKLFSIIFADATRGVAVGNLTSSGDVPTIRYTRDAATSLPWQTPTAITLGSGGVGGIPGGLRDVAFSGFTSPPVKAIYWAAGELGIILNSRDDGDHWSQYIPPDPANPSQPKQPLNFAIRGVTFLNTTTGLFVGQGPDSLGSPIRGVAFQYRKVGTTITWTDLSPALQDCSNLSDVVISGNTAFAVGDAIDSNGRRGTILASTATGGVFATFGTLGDAGLPIFQQCTTNDSHNDVAGTPVLIEAEIDPQNGDLWVGGQCGRVWKRTSAGVWTEYKSHTDTHMEGISFPPGSNHGYFGGKRDEQPQHAMVRFTKP